MKRFMIAALSLLLMVIPAYTMGQDGELGAEFLSMATQAEAEIRREETGDDTAAIADVPACFAAEGEADYTYEDEGIAIQIKKFDEYDVVFFVCDIQVADTSHLLTALSGDAIGGKTEKVSDIAQRNGAVLAINGDDYGVHKYGVIIRNGELIRAKDTTRHMLTLDENGNFAVVTDRSEDPQALGARLMEAGIRQAWEFGPVLVLDGEAVSFDTDFKLIPTKAGVREPRTGIGQIGPLHYIIIVVDGRREDYSRGLSLPQFQALFVRFGAQVAFNLDGGGSTTLYFDGKILNRPSQNAQRRVSDIVMFK